MNDSNEKNNNQESEEKADGLFADVVKKALSVGIGAAFMTEDVVKKYINDLPIPKDMASGLLQQAKGAKEEFLQSIQEEVRKRFDKIDPKKLVDEIVKKYDIEVNATFRFKPRDSSEDIQSDDE